MAKALRIVVRGKPRVELDPLVLLQVLLTVCDEPDSPLPTRSVDALQASIEDRLAVPEVNEPTREATP